MTAPRYGTPEFRAAARRPRPKPRPPQTVRVHVTRSDGTRWPFVITVEDRPGWRQRYMACLESARAMVPEAC